MIEIGLDSAIGCLISMWPLGLLIKSLAREIDRLIKTETALGDKCNPETAGDVDQELYEKYSGELYGVACSITGERLRVWLGQL